MKLVFCLFLSLLLFYSCNTTTESTQGKSIKLVTLDPGHFHAALVQKIMYEDVDSVVHVYAPEGNDVMLHLDRINAFNSRADNPTQWEEVIYTGKDFFERMLEKKDGNVVVLAGNNQKKTEYILQSLQNGFNVLADKPMVISSDDFNVLSEAFAIAEKHDLLLYDIMTERFEITTILQKELSLLPHVFGTLEKGTPENPAVTKESVHHFFKYVSGNILTRPPWFMDVEQEGEGLVDVTTHLVDLIQWECFPDQVIDYTKEIRINSARRWPTTMSLNEFSAITKLDKFPDYLDKDKTNDTTLAVYCNGEINYELKGVCARVSVTWAYQAPEGAGDTHYSIMRGTKSNLIIRQGEQQQYKPTLYIEPMAGKESLSESLSGEFKKISSKFPGVSLKESEKGWEVVIPASYREGHEAHFARVTEKFLTYLKEQNMPAWEVPNMLAKYYVTTKALEMAKK